MIDVLRRIGGPDSVSVVGCLVLLVVMYSAALLSSGVDAQASFWQLTAASLLALAAAFAWLVAARLTLLRTAAQHPLIGRTLAVFGIAFVLRAVVFDRLLLALGTTTESDLVYRLAASLSSFGLGLPMMAYIVSLAREFTANQASTNTLRLKLHELRRSALGRIRAHREQLQQHIRVSLTRELAALLTDAPPVALERMRSAIEETVRPVSRQLATTVPEFSYPPTSEPTRVQWSAVLRNVFAENPIRPLAFSMWVFAVALGVTAPRTALLTSLSYSMLVAIAGVVLLALASRVWTRAVQRSPMIARGLYFTATVTLIAAVAANIAQLFPSLAEQPPGVLLAAVLTAVLIGWMVALLFSLRREVERSAQVLQAVRVDFTELMVIINTRLREQQLAISRALHGPVQDALTAAAIRLAQAISTDSTSPQLIAGLQRSIFDSLADVAQVEPRQVNVNAALTDLAELWRGVVTIHTEVDDEATRLLAKHPATANTVAEIVREGCANAIRHGQAETVMVRVRPAERRGTIWVEVHNDGLPVDAEADWGVGSALLNELTIEWSRIATPEGGTSLRALVPIA